MPAIINNQPLVYIGDDINSQQIITPANFLIMNPKTGIPDTQILPNDSEIMNMSTGEKILQSWKKGHSRLQEFWTCWKNNYLLSLRERDTKVL